MREIKFRGWNTKAKIMLDLKAITPLALNSSFCSENGLYLPFRDDVILEQFTGLRDKNGKEIYEGDKVRLNNKVGVVTWDKDNAGFIIVGEGFYDYMGSRFSWNELEVIGNIHDKEA